MCLITNTTIPTILDKDLVVYKVFTNGDDGIYSIYQNYRYDIRKTYHNEEINSEPYYIIDQEIPDEYVVAEAYHACTTLDRAKEHLYPESYIYKCVIPKGSKVFYDMYVSEIASDTIIVKRRLWFNRF